MSESVSCFFEQDPVEIGVAARNYEGQHCCACSNHAFCKRLKEGEVREPKGGNQNDSY